MRSTTLWVVFTLFVILYQVNAIPVASPKETKEPEKLADENSKPEKLADENSKAEKLADEESGADSPAPDTEEKTADEDDDKPTDEDGDDDEQPKSEDEDEGSAAADKPKERRDADETEEKGVSAKSSKRQCCCGGGCHGGSWGIHDLCHHCHGDGWCGAGCMCGNCCGGFGCPVTNHGCNGGCCPSVTFPCSFGACVNNPCCECCREPAPPGKCKWPCLWPCCCECTPPKFKFKPLKPKPVCHCPHTSGGGGGCCGHRRSNPTKRQFVTGPFAPGLAPDCGQGFPAPGFAAPCYPAPGFAAPGFPAAGFAGGLAPGYAPYGQDFLSHAYGFAHPYGAMPAPGFPMGPPFPY
ncbi:uncharacterized protein LOC116617360 isoform X3 [Nematostella vectensis]|uniref:uncharacterized protein LOC116617360 isoform X3 n=1 Tax=Nematostella vectensis TaxID=45351 RepID=UPI002077163D|nr:uncharacterized protein LOC116617360 isoform X3 [Nematostella vectensis]